MKIKDPVSLSQSVGPGVPSEILSEAGGGKNTDRIRECFLRSCSAVRWGKNRAISVSQSGRTGLCSRGAAGVHELEQAVQCRSSSQYFMFHHKNNSNCWMETKWNRAGLAGLSLGQELKTKNYQHKGFTGSSGARQDRVSHSRQLCDWAEQSGRQ